MAIKKYTATQDTTITNAFKPGLATRGTGSNMGMADTTAVFEIYGQATTSSIEKSRVLYQFPVSTILTDRDAGTIPASGSVKFYLRLFNAKTATTVPQNVTYVIHALSRSWDEGVGMDVDSYKDKGIANWIFASTTKPKASGSITIKDYSQAGSGTPLVQLTGSSTNYEFTAIDTNCGTSCPAGDFDSEGSNNETATNLAALINSSASADFSANAVSAIVYVTASSGGSGGNSNSMTSSVAAWGSVTGVSSDAANTLLSGGFDGTPWTTKGGDWYTDSSSSFSVTLDTGLEDFSVNITDLAEQWISASNDSPASTDSLGSKTNYGVVVKLSGAFEDGSNNRTYYQKKFFARGTEFFFKKPVLEARWDKSVADDSAKFYQSSSLAPAADNLMNLYMYNFIDGELSNIPAIGTGPILLSVYSGTLDNTAPTGSKLKLAIGGGVVAGGDTDVTGGYVKTGIYSASFAYSNKFADNYNSNATDLTTLFPIWHTGSTGELYTGSAVAVKTRSNLSIYNTPSYRFSITNLKPSYSRDETALLRIFSQDRGREINIYTVSNASPQGQTLENFFYKVQRVSDDTVIVNFSTGSVVYSKLSYDHSGSYFNFDMSNLEGGYMYEIKLLYKHAGNYREARETFKFRVEE
tara:strand:+ start:954 stop:2867 length:1914 start_codon:yes stop_codon:yes gene_type:complete